VTKRILIASILGVVLAAGAAAPAAGQTPAPAAPAMVPRGSTTGSVEGGVDLGMGVRNRGETDTYKSGWYAGGSFYLVHTIHLIGLLGADYRSESGFTANVYTYSGGVRFESEQAKKVKPFIQLLMGGAQDNGTGDGTKNRYPVLTPGGGADFGVAKHVVIRARLDFPLFMKFGNDVYKGTRFSTGIVIPIGQ